MTTSPIDLDDPNMVSIIDETPLWSAPFGTVLLERVRLLPSIRVLDVGSGLGFPAIELAQRLGTTSQIFALDPWRAGLDRIRLKYHQMGIRNITPLEAEAETIPLGDACCSLIVSNNGLNNVTDPAQAWQECFRVAKPQTQVVVTENTPDTMHEFYTCFREVLEDMGLNACLSLVDEQIYSKRKPLAQTRQWIENTGFQITDITEHAFTMRFLDGTTLFEHFLIRLAFLESWVTIVAEEARRPVFQEVEKRLNKQAQQQGELRLSVPFRCIEARKCQ